MPLEFDLEPTFRVVAIAIVLYALVWASAPLARRLVTRKTQKLLQAARRQGKTS